MEQGIEIRQSGAGQLTFEIELTDGAGVLITSGTADLRLFEVQDDASLKQYDFNDDTFKTTALGDPSLALTHRQTDNATYNTGIWSVRHQTLTGFTRGRRYLYRVSHSSLVKDLTGRLQYGAAEGDLLVSSAGRAEADVLLWRGSQPNTLNAGRVDANVGSMSPNVLTASAVDAGAVTEMQAGLATAAALVTAQADLDDLQTRVPAALTAGGQIKASIESIQNDAQSATDLKDFADAGYDPATNKVEGVKLADTLTTYTGNTVQTGDSFARLGAPAGVSVSADIAAATNNVANMHIDLDARIPATLDGANMRSSVKAMDAGIITATVIADNAIDAASLAADVATELQSGLATSASIATLQALVDDLEGRLTALRAGYLDNLNVGGNVASSAEAAAIQADTDNLQTRIPAALVGGRMDASVGAVAAGAITAAAIATDAIDADALAADAVTELQSGLATSAALSAVATDVSTAATQSTAAATSAASADTKATTILSRLGAWTGTGINTVLGGIRALAAKFATGTPTDISTGTTFDNTTDSLEALSDAAATGLTAQGVANALLLAPVGSAADNSAMDYLAEIRQDTQGLDGVTITVVSPTVEGDEATLAYAFDFFATEGQSIDVTLAAGDDLTAVGITLDLIRARDLEEIACTITATAARVVRIEMSKAQVETLGRGRHQLRIQSTRVNGHLVNEGPVTINVT